MIRSTTRPMPAFDGEKWLVVDAETDATYAICDSMQEARAYAGALAALADMVSAAAVSSRVEAEALAGRERGRA